MPAPLKFDFFRGEAPKHKPRLLPPGYGQKAFNCKLYDGKLKPWFGMTTVDTPAKAGTIQTIYPMRDSGDDIVWLEWIEDVNVVEGLIAGDTTQRICYTGYGSPKATNFALADAGSAKPADWWRLGVPAPITAASVASGGGGAGTARDRVYLVTFVHVWADGKTEESAPSPASAIISAKSGETINLSSIPRWVVTATSISRTGGTATATIPAGRTNWFGNNDRVTIAGAVETEYNGIKEITRLSDTAFTYPVSGAPATPATGTITVKTNHNITKKRIYRTVIGNAGAFYRFVAEVNESDTTYADSATDTTVALNEAIPSTGWDMPPLDLKNIVSLGNGILSGFAGNQACFSEPYYAHAWPARYRRTLPFDGVGAGVIGTSLVIGTKGHPVVYSGTHPATMAENKLVKVNHPCLSKRGVASLGFAVVFPAREGAVAVTEGGVSVATIGYHDRDTWKEIFPETMTSFQFSDRYFANYLTGVDGQGNPVGGALIMDRENNVGGLATLNLVLTAGHFDKRTGDLYVVHDGKIKKWDDDMVNRLVMDWRSRMEVLPKPGNYGAARIDCEFTLTAAEVAAIAAAAAAVVAANALIGARQSQGELNILPLNEMTLNGSLIQTPPGIADAQYLTFSLYAGGELQFTKSLTEDIGVFRLPAGYKEDTLEIGIAGNVLVHRVVLGETPKSLEKV